MRKERGALLVPTMFIWIFAATTVSAIPLAPSWRVGKAIEYCIADGQTKDECTSMVADMSKEDVLAYIKDTQERPRF